MKMEKKILLKMLKTHINERYVVYVGPYKYKYFSVQIGPADLYSFHSIFNKRYKGRRAENSNGVI